MIIHGINKLTLLDYPGHTACTVFTGKCNFRCPFCQNDPLVLFPEREPKISENELFSFLEKRRGILEGVCITGGEPTVSSDLLEFLSQIKALGYLVKLDTNGANPELLKAAVEGKLVDYIAMDIKSSLDYYSQATGIPDLDLSLITKSTELLMQCEIPYEFRTTIVRELHNKEILLSIANWLCGAEHYYLQAFKDSSALINKFTSQPITLSGYSRDELFEFVRLLTPYFKTVAVRGV